MFAQPGAREGRGARGIPATRGWERALLPSWFRSGVARTPSGSGRVRQTVGVARILGLGVLCSGHSS